jgi:hypothetical protein
MDINMNMKRETLWEMNKLIDSINRKIAILNALDRDTSTSHAYDLTDQIIVMEEKIRAFYECVERALSVCGEMKDE